MKQLSDEDRRVLALTRAVDATLARSWVDRLTPSDLLSRAPVGDSPCVRDFDGVRYRQARENLKKLRAIVRRYQNRGYATLARVVAHIERLAVGDESNAAIDAHDAVSLMTVHASKGLEFPIVFVVNMDRGTGNSRAPIRVVADVKGEPSVAIADYQSEADEDSVARSARKPSGCSTSRSRAPAIGCTCPDRSAARMLPADARRARRGAARVGARAVHARRTWHRRGDVERQRRNGS